MPWQKGQKAWNNQRVMLICKHCSNPYEVSPNRAETSKYCSRLCQNRSQSLVIDRNGKNNPMWSGDKAGYNAIHQWHLKHWIKSGICEHCKLKKKTDWAHKKDTPMLRDVRENWLELCRSCHTTYDGKAKPVVDYVKKNGPHNKLKLIPCIACGKPVKPLKRTYGYQKFCSHTCYLNNQKLRN